jgi:cytoskeletal protein CcmA (bactofilin family)
MFKSKGLEKDYNVVAVAQPERSAVDQHVTTLMATPVSCIGSGMSIIGNVECSGPAQVFGRIEGEMRATELVIGEGAQIEGSIQAQEVTISGRVKGTIRAIRVKLQGANVEGDIIHRTLSIDESSVFEGNSRRVENPVERRADNTAESSSPAGKAGQKKIAQSPSLVVPSAVPATNGSLQPN